MESAALPKIPPIPSLNPHLPRRPRQSLSVVGTTCFSAGFHLRRKSPADAFSSAGNLFWGPPFPAPPRRLASISSAAALPGSGGGGDGLAGGSGGWGGGGGDGGSSGGETETKDLAVGGGSEEVPGLDSDVIVLSVGGMSCGGCVASVKRILESLPQVSSATVDLKTETAFVWVAPEAKVTENWQLQLGETLANHLTTCGFKSNFRGQGDAIGVIQS